MKPSLNGIVIRFTAAISTFVIGCALFTVFPTLRMPALTESSVKPVSVDSGCKEYPGVISSTAQTPVLEYCEIARHPDCYGGKLVLMKAILSDDDHGMYFYGTG